MHRDAPRDNVLPASGDVPEPVGLTQGARRADLEMPTSASEGGGRRPGPRMVPAGRGQATRSPSPLPSLWKGQPCPPFPSAQGDSFQTSDLQPWERINVCVSATVSVVICHSSNGSWPTALLCDLKVPFL